MVFRLPVSPRGTMVSRPLDRFRCENGDAFQTASKSRVSVGADLKVRRQRQLQGVAALGAGDIEHQLELVPLF